MFIKERLGRTLFADFEKYRFLKETEKDPGVKEAIEEVLSVIAEVAEQLVHTEAWKDVYCYEKELWVDRMNEMRRDRAYEKRFHEAWGSVYDMEADGE